MKNLNRRPQRFTNSISPNEPRVPKNVFRPIPYASSGQTSLPLKPSTPETNGMTIPLSNFIPIPPSKPSIPLRPENRSASGTSSTLRPSRPEIPQRPILPSQNLRSPKPKK